MYTVMAVGFGVAAGLLVLLLVLITIRFLLTDEAQ